MGLPCAICGRPIHYDEPSDSKHPLSFVIDERVPVSRWREGGFNNPTHAALDPDNVQPTHWICNAQKGARTMGELYALQIPRGDNGGPRPHKEIHPTMRMETQTQTRTHTQTPPVINLPDGDW